MFFMRRLVFALWFFLTPAMALAHSLLVLSEPGQDAVLDAAPATLTLVFSDALRLTALESGGQKIAVPEQSGFATQISVDLPDLLDGIHLFQWRGLSVDGHATKGTLSFRVK